MVASTSRRDTISRRHRSRLLAESLEPRWLLSTFTVGSASNDALTNGTLLYNVLTGKTKDDSGSHFLQLGDTIVLAAGAQYEKKGTGFVLPYLTGTGTVTIETSGIASLPPSGTRVDPSYEQYMAQILAPGGNVTAMSTATGGGSNAPHNFTLIGLEFTAASEGAGTVSTSLLILGDNSSTQSTVASAPSNFVVDRCYFHSFENTPGLTDPNTSIQNAILLAGSNMTVENNYISDIHELGGTKEAHGVAGSSNGVGNYTITNNFIEASTENIFFGGGVTWIPNQNTTNVTITHNLVAKDPSWNPNDPTFNNVGYPKTPDGSLDTYWVKNLIEFKEGINVIIDQNVFENCWINGDQRGQAIEIGSINQGATASNPSGNTWVETANVTVTNNVIRNCAVAFDLNIEGTSGTPSSLPIHDITIRNNLAYNIGGQQADNQATFFVINGNSFTGANITIDHNTAFNTDDWGEISDSKGAIAFLTNFTCTNNIAFAGQYGLFGSNAGNNEQALNAYAPGYSFSGNLVIGYSGTYAFPANNYIPPSQDATGFVDVPGEDFQLLSTSPYYADGTGGTTPGINFSTFLQPADFTSIDGSSTTPYLTNYYKFDEGSGTSVKNNAPGASTGNGTLSSALWTASGEMNSAFAPTGGTSGVTTVSSGFTASSPFTFSAWINPTVVNVSQYIASTKNSSGASSFALSINSSGKVVAAGTTGSITSSTALTAGTWNMITLVFDGTNLMLFQNGVEVGSVAGTTTTGATTLYIGGNKGAVSCFDGAIDEVRYYNTALTAPWQIGYSSADPNIPQQQYEIYKQFLPRTDFIEGNIDVTGLTTGRSTWAVDHDGSTPSYSFTNYSYEDLSHNAGSTTAILTGANTFAPGLSFTAAGYYTLQLSVTDGENLTTTVIDRTIKVIACPQNLVISPATATVQFGGTVSFTVSNSPQLIDQFGNPWTFSEEPYAWQAVLTATGNGAYANGTIADQGVVGSTDTGLYTAKPASPGKGLIDTVYFTVDGIEVGSKSSVTVTTGATLPNAPSNLNITTVGTSSIAMQWTDNSTNESGFHIYRSTDNATWGSPYATVGANVTTYTDSAPTAGVPYYYEVTAYNSAGNSSAAGITSPAATVIASDEFNYSTSTGWAGGNTGVGFASNWTPAHSSFANIVSGLTYTSDSGNILTSADNAVQVTTSNTVTGTLSSSVGTVGSTAWISFEASTYNTGTFTTPETEIDLGATSSNWVKLGFPVGRFGMLTQISGVNTNYNSTTTPAFNTTYFMVYSIQYLTTGDIITMYADPTPGASSPTGWLATGSLTLPASLQLSTTSTVILRENTSFGVSTYDELRLGVSYASVAPDASGGIPAAATNFAATVTQSITLNWTDNATNATGISIERSTDNATWTPVAGLSPTDTTWTDDNVDPTAAYYYRIYAYNASGDSPYAYTGEASAVVLAADEFNYTAESDFNNGNTGVGFAGGWSLAGTSNISVTSGSLNYSANGHALETAGNAVTLGNGSTATQTLSNSVGNTGSTLWAGFEFSSYSTNTGQAISAEVDIGSSTNEVRLGAPFNGNVDAAAVVGSTTYYLNGTTAVAANTTYFVAYSIQYLTTGDIINMYVNPTPGVVPTAASASLTLPATANLSPTSTVVLKHAQSFSVATFDELRLGSSYMSVAPDPIVPASPAYSANTAAASNLTLPSFSSNPTIHFSPILSTLPIPTASIDFSARVAPSDYHLGADGASNADAADPTLDSTSNLLDQLLLV